MIDLTEELKLALRTKNKPVKMAISDLKGRIKNFLIEKGLDYITDEQFVTIVKSAIKITKETLVLFADCNKPEIIDEETKKLVYLKKFLPEQFSEEELRSVIKDIIIETEALSVKKDMGKVMRATRKKIAESGKDAENSLVSSIIRSMLS